MKTKEELMQEMNEIWASQERERYYKVWRINKLKLELSIETRDALIKLNENIEKMIELLKRVGEKK